MAKNQKLGGNMLGRIFLGSAIMVLMVGAPVFLTSTWAAIDTFIRITGPNGVIDGGSKDPAHMNWIAVSSVVAGDLNGDAMADQEMARKSASDSWSAPTKADIGSQPSGAGAGKVTATAPRDMATGMASGKRMHKPFTITKEVDKASPLLVKACASGQHFPKVEVQLASGEKYTLTDVMVASDQMSSGDRPMETISFTYQKIEMTR